MAKSLVIVESPAKAKTIEKFLGKDFVVKSSGGHIRDLPTHRLGVKVDNEFEPVYVVIKDKKKIITDLKKAASKKEHIYLAPDPDREGEAIAWHLNEVLELDKDRVKRVEFHEITKGAVVKALENPRDIDLDSVNAQQARRVLDRLVGYKLSPLLWKKVKKGLSAGRVQSVAVSLICDREAAILAFVPEEYWTVNSTLKQEKTNVNFSAVLAKKDNKNFTIRNEDECNLVLNQLKKSTFSVHKVEQKVQKRKPAAPFITSTLQQEASRKLGWSTKKTMMIAQKLYEGLNLNDEQTGLITYMRTDSIRVSEEARSAAREFIKDSWGEEYISTVKPSTKSKAKIQDAHEAIRPTYVEKRPEEIKEFINKDEFQLYNLIWKRFISSQMAPAELAITTIWVNADIYTFKASGSIIKFPGFMTLYIEGKDEEDQDDGEINLPSLTKGETVSPLAIDHKQNFTKPPARFSEATLVRTLEEKGIGRPSTYSPIISTILERGYVRLESKKLHPTELGTIVSKQLKEHFSSVINPDFTAGMEAMLDNIMAGKSEWTSVLDKFYQSFSQELSLAEQNMPKMKPKPKESGELCDKCGAKMVIKESRYGSFLACSAFPECKNTKSILQKTDVPCPKCGGEIIEKKTKKGKPFYGCSKYPECNFALWNKPSNEKCPECGGLMTYSRKNTLKCEDCKAIKVLTDEKD